MGAAFEKCTSGGPPTGSADATPLPSRSVSPATGASASASVQETSLSPVADERPSATKIPTTIGGGKDIALAAGVILLINNITGPGVPQLPNLFVESGWLLPMLCTLGVWFISTLSAAMYSEAMRNIPGNEDFCGRAEYSTIVTQCAPMRSPPIAPPTAHMGRRPSFHSDAPQRPHSSPAHRPPAASSGAVGTSRRRSG